MTYPAVLLPIKGYKKIETNLEDCYISRTVPSKDFIHPNTKCIRFEFLFSDSDLEAFDYSTNLLGHFTVDHCYIQLIGKRKKYFRNYWNFVEEVELPIFNQDFIHDSDKGVIYLLVGSIHNSIKCPYSKDKNIEAFATSVIVHTPSRSNFWHFSIKWLDQEGNFINCNKAAWKNSIVSTFRVKLCELILGSLPSTPRPIESCHYCNN